MRTIFSTTKQRPSMRVTCPGWPNSQASAQTPPDAVTANQGTAPTAGASLASSVVAVTTGGITFDLLFDSAAMAAPASFRAGIEQAATMLANTISDKITVDIKIDYSGTGGGAAAGPDSGLTRAIRWSTLTLSTVRRRGIPRSTPCRAEARSRDNRTSSSGTPR